MITLNNLAFQRLETVNENLKHKDHFTYAFLADTRGPDANNPINTQILSEILNQINKLPETPAFVLDGGDLAFQGTVANLKEFRRIIEKHPLSTKKRVPFFTLPGNHEIYQPNNMYQFNLKNFRKIIGETQFVISIPKFHFQVLAMDNVTSLPPIDHKIQYGFSQNAIHFMNNQINKNRNGKTVIAFHTPPHFGCWKKHSMNKQQTKQFVHEVIKKHPKKVPLVLTSHIHAYSEKIKDGTAYVLSGGGGAPLVSKKEFPCVEPVFNFVVFKVTLNSLTGTVYKRETSGHWVKSPIKL